MVVIDFYLYSNIPQGLQKQFLLHTTMATMHLINKYKSLNYPEISDICVRDKEIQLYVKQASYKIKV